VVENKEEKEVKEEGAAFHEGEEVNTLTEEEKREKEKK